MLDFEACLPVSGMIHVTISCHLAIIQDLQSSITLGLRWCAVQVAA